MGKKKVNKKGKKTVKNKKPSKSYEKYKVEGDKVVRAKSCPKCGTGYFLAEHKDRLYCGKCHYVEFKGKETKASVPSKQVVEGKPVEAKKEEPKKK